MLNNIELKNYIKLYKKNRELINENNEIYENYEYMLRMLMSNIYGDIGADYLEDVLDKINEMPQDNFDNIIKKYVEIINNVPYL